MPFAPEEHRVATLLRLLDADPRGSGDRLAIGEAILEVALPPDRT
jgi:hypothetical protein